MTTIYLVSAKHPCSKIKEVDAVILASGQSMDWRQKPRKLTWAEYRGHRYLLGATAFYTRASALRAKVGHLTKIAKTPALAFIQPELYKKARAILKEGVTE